MGYPIMSLIRITCAGPGAHQPLHPNTTRSTSVRLHSIKQTRQPHAAPIPSTPRKVKQRRLRCDCGQLAITHLTVRVGSDPQYIISLPLCPACLILEQELHRNKGD